jgi:hypothetical protein
MLEETIARLPEVDLQLEPKSSSSSRARVTHIHHKEIRHRRLSSGIYGESRALRFPSTR